MQAVPLPTSVEEGNQDIKYEARYESGIRDATKERRAKARFESLNVLTMGKSRKHRKLETKMEREARQDDAIVINKSESEKNGDPRPEKEIDRVSVEKTGQDRKLIDYQDMGYETESDSIERKTCSDNIGTSRGEIGQDRSGKTNESSDEKETKMVRYEGKLKYIENIKNYKGSEESV